MKLSNVTLFSAAALLAFASCQSVSAHSDVLLTDVGGQVTIGAAADLGSSPSFDIDTKVFESIMLPGFLPPVTPPDYQSDEPGFFGLDSSIPSEATALAGLGASALPGLADVKAIATTFTIDGASSDLFFWDGTGPVDFDPAPAGTGFTFNPSNFATTGSDGGMDDHPLFEVDATSGTAADGVYLISPVVAVDGIATSEKFYMAFLVDSLITGEVDAEEVEHALEELEEGLIPAAIALGKDFTFFEEAVEFAETLPVPEPSSLLLCVAGLGLAVTRRRGVSQK